MFFHLIYPLKIYFSPFNIFYYITFRSICAIITSLFIFLLFGSMIIRYLKRKNFTQIVRTDGPKTHIGKTGTPTMGGTIVFFACVTSTLLWARLDNRFILWMLGSICWFGFIGWLDDYFKIIKRHPGGLSAKWKILSQLLLGIILSFYLFLYPQNPLYRTAINVPYLKEVFLELGLLYCLLVIFLVVASSNAVNLTDGLDGLAIGCLITSWVSFGIFTYLAGNIKFAEYLKIIYVRGCGELTVFLSALVGAGLGFLWFNSYPAQIFLGDTGSLFLGATLGLTAIFAKHELILPIVGGIFVVEALSVMLQVFSYKKYKKRIFRMAPLHHHYELSGLAEPKITIRFWIVSIILALIALSSLKIR